MTEPTKIRPDVTTEDEAIRKSVKELDYGLIALWSSADAIYCNHDTTGNMGSDHVLGISYLMKQEAWRLMEAFETVKKELEGAS